MRVPSMRRRHRKAITIFPWFPCEEFVHPTFASEKKLQKKTPLPSTTTIITTTNNNTRGENNKGRSLPKKSRLGKNNTKTNKIYRVLVKTIRNIRKSSIWSCIAHSEQLQVLNPQFTCTKVSLQNGFILYREDGARALVFETWSSSPAIQDQNRNSYTNRYFFGKNK